MSLSADVIVVGSGPSAVHAAHPLVEAGVSVLMLDVGHEETRYEPLIPELPFSEIRRGDRGQHRYFLGDDFEAVPLGRVRVGAQLTAPRSYLARDTDLLTPLRSSSFTPTESLALGGLGGGWGASSIQFTAPDLEGFPITEADLAPHYAAVSERIGLSGALDDLLPFYGDCPSLQPPLASDAGARAMMERYQARREALNREGFFMGHPRLAVLSRDLGDRSAQPYRDMDFYSDARRSVYRPRFTVEAMRVRPNFSYARPWLVESFREPGPEGAVEVSAMDPRDGSRGTFTARRLVLAAGVLGTARIVLRSFGLYDAELPIACNAHIYVPCINLPMLGKPATDRRHSLTQAGIIFDPDGDRRHLVYSEAHVYGSLLLFKLAKDSFLPVPEAARILRELMSAFLILVIEHEDHPTPAKRCRLVKGAAGAPDVLQVDYALDAAERSRQRAAEKRLLRHVRSLGCIPFQRIDPGHGSSIHYGGTLPMTREEAPLTTTPSCLLRGTRGVYIADGSVLPYLPAKPLTLTLMANADRVGTIIRGDLA